MIDDRSLMEIRADTGFTYDARGRMLLTHEPRAAERRPAPRFLLGRTVDGYVLRFGATVPDALVQRLTKIGEAEPVGGDLQIPPATLAAVRAALERDGPIASAGGGPAYRFPEEFTAAREAIRLTAATIEAVRATFPWLHDELADWWPCFAVLRDGAAVSVCFSARTGAQAAEAGVETRPDFRGRGYAATVTAAWGAAIQASGRIPLYSTSWDNLASQSVARRVGLVTFGTDASWA
jgi:hypothetical protein